MFNITNGTAIVIVSAERPQYNHAANAERSARLERQLAQLVQRGDAFASWPGMGSYKGQQERCFVVVALASDAAHIAESIGPQYGQECALVIDSVQAGTLVYPDGQREAIGHVRYVTDVTGLDAYTTLDGHAGGWVVDIP